MQDEQFTDEGESPVLDNEATNKEVDNETEKDETPEESARIALRELQAEANTEGNTAAEESDTSGTTEQPTQAKVDPAQPKKPEIEAVDPLDLEPPARLSAKEKALFNKFPKAFKPAVARMFKEHQSSHSKLQSEYNKAATEARHVVEAVRPYYTRTPELAAAGITESAFISALVGAHQKLTDPKTDKATISKLAADRGYKIKFVQQNGEEETESNPQPVANIADHPQFSALQNQIHQLTSMIQGERANAIAAPIEAEWESIRSQKDLSGRYLYPEMHDKAFWDEASPLITALTNKGVSHGDALKRVHYAITGRVIRPSATNNNQNSRANSAAISVRGRSAPPVTQHINGIEIGANETPEQSARIALEELRRGMN